MKNLKYFIFAIMIFIFGTVNVSASTVTIHYGGSDRLPTYTWANTYVGGIHTVNGYNNVGNSNVENQLNNSVMFVAHNHGSPGQQYLSSSTGIVGTNGNNSSWKSISSMSINTLKPLYIAIYYGCKTGRTTSSYGNIMSITTTKKSKSAVAWTENTYIIDVNLWNKYFFYKAATFTTGASALTYADTQLAADSGAINAYNMKNKRVTSGVFNWQFGTMVQSNNSNNGTNYVTKNIHSGIEVEKSINILNHTNLHLKLENSYINSFNNIVSIYIDDDLNEYLFINDNLIGYINNNNVINNSLKKDKVEDKADVVFSYLDKLLKDETNISDYVLIDTQYLEATDEYSFVFGKKKGDYLVNDGIIISVNSNNELVSFVAAQQGLFDKYNDIKINRSSVEKFVSDYMNSKANDVRDYSIDKQFFNIVDGKLVLQLGIELVHQDGHYSTDVLYYDIVE